MLEIDVYEGRLSGLVVLEVEFQNSEESVQFVPPPEFNLIEVTGDKRYSNKQLARNGLP